MYVMIKFFLILVKWVYNSDLLYLTTYYDYFGCSSYALVVNSVPRFSWTYLISGGSRDAPVLNKTPSFHPQNI